MGCVASSENGDREERRRRRRENRKKNNGRSSRRDETPTRYERRGDDADSDTEGRATEGGTAKAKGSKSRKNKAAPARADSDDETRRTASNRDTPKNAKRTTKQQPSPVDPLYTVSSAATRKGCVKQPPGTMRTRDSPAKFESSGPTAMRSSLDSPRTRPNGSCTTPPPRTTSMEGDTPPLPIPALATFDPEKRRSPQAATPLMQHNVKPHAHGTPHGYGDHRRHHRRERDICDVHTPNFDGGRSHGSANDLSTSCLTEAALATHVAATSQGTTMSNGRTANNPLVDAKKTKRPGIMRWVDDCHIDGSDPSPLVESAAGFGGSAMTAFEPVPKGSAQAIEMELYERLSRAGSVSSSGTRRSFLE